MVIEHPNHDIYWSRKTTFDFSFFSNFRPSARIYRIVFPQWGGKYAQGENSGIRVSRLSKRKVVYRALRRKKGGEKNREWRRDIELQSDGSEPLNFDAHPAICEWALFSRVRLHFLAYFDWWAFEGPMQPLLFPGSLESNFFTLGLIKLTLDYSTWCFYPLA